MGQRHKPCKMDHLNSCRINAFSDWNCDTEVATGTETSKDHEEVGNRVASKSNKSVGYVLISLKVKTKHTYPILK